MEKQWKANPSSDNDLLFQFSNTFPSFSTYFEMSFKVSLRSTELHSSAISINSARSRTYQDPGRKDRSMKWIEVMYSDVSFAASTIKYYSKISGLHRQILMLQRAPSSHHGTGVWQWSQCCPDSWYSQCKNQRTKPVQNLEVGPGWKKNINWTVGYRSRMWNPKLDCSVPKITSGSVLPPYLLTQRIPPVLVIRQPQGNFDVRDTGGWHQFQEACSGLPPVHHIL